MAAVLWLLTGVLSGLLVLCDGAALVGRVPTERWLVPRRTFTKIEVRTSTRTETAAASCYHFEPDLPACREARDVIEASTTLPQFHGTTYTPSLAYSSEPEDQFTTSEDYETTPDWSQREFRPNRQSSDTEVVPRYESSINKNYKNWGFLGFNIDTTVTTVKTVFETKRILDPNNIVTLTIADCKPTKLAFDIPLCEEDIIIKPTAVINTDMSMFSTSDLVVVNKNDGSAVDIIIIPSVETTQVEAALEVEKDVVTIATKPLVMATASEKVSVTLPVDVETTESDEDTTIAESQDLITTHIHKDAVEETITEVMIIPIIEPSVLITDDNTSNNKRVVDTFDSSNTEVTTDIINTESETQTDNDVNHTLVLTEPKNDEPILIEVPSIQTFEDIEKHVTDPIIEKNHSIVNNVEPMIVDSVTKTPAFVESINTEDQIVSDKDNFKQDLVKVENHDAQIMFKPVPNFVGNIPVTVIKYVTVLDKLEPTSDEIVLAKESPNTVKDETVAVEDTVATDVDLKDIVEINEETSIEATELPTETFFTVEEVVTVIPDNSDSIEQTIATLKNIVKLTALKQNNDINLQLKSTNEANTPLKYEENDDKLRKIDKISSSSSSFQSDAIINKNSDIENGVISLNESSLKQIEGLQAVFETPAVADTGAGAVPPHVAPAAPAAAAADTLQPDSSRVAMETARGA